MDPEVNVTPPTVSVFDPDIESAAVDRDGLGIPDLVGLLQDQGPAVSPPRFPAIAFASGGIEI